MGLIRRIADYFDPAETRAKEVSWDALKGSLDVGGAIASPRLAENLAVVMSCVQAISSALSSLPFIVYRVMRDGREEDPGHPVAQMVANGANDFQSWPDFVEWLTAQCLLRGNGLAEIVTDGTGRVRELRPVPWETVSVSLLATGRLVYDVAPTTTIQGSTGRPRRLLQDEVLHVRDRSDDGILGRSRLARAASVVSAGLSMQQFTDSLFANGARPSGMLSYEGRLTDEQLARLGVQFRESFGGPTRAGKALVLDSGVKWSSLSLDMESAQFLESRRFTTEELCRLFNVPPTVVGDLTNSSFTNSETTVRWFAQATLAPWITKLEHAIARSVFSAATRSTHRLEIDMAGLLRGDPQQRWNAWQIARQNDILSVNEIREIEGFGPRGAASAPA